MENSNAEKKSCKGFNFCFWAKLLVAIPALPIVAYYAASFFTDTYWQMLAGSAAIGLTIWIAVLLDKQPALQCMVRVKKD